MYSNAPPRLPALLITPILRKQSVIFCVRYSG